MFKMQLEYYYYKTLEFPSVCANAQQEEGKRHQEEAQTEDHQRAHPR
jgi:hypothetical protein